VSEDSFLSDDFLGQLIGVGEVDLIVGMPSFNDAKTVGGVLRAIEEGVLRNYRRERVVLLSVDGGSRDGTREVLREASSLGKSNGLGIESLRTLRWITTRVGHEGIHGNALRTFVAATELLRAKGCAVIAASSANVSPSWVDTLLRPIYWDQCDFVAPLYRRHRFDGLLSRNLLYPLSAALFAKPLRELHATEFAFSSNLATSCLSQQQWNQEAVRDSAEMWMALHAMSNSYRCCQTYLGDKPLGERGANVVAAIRQAVNGLFWCVEAMESYWSGEGHSDPVLTFGPESELSSAPIRFDRSKFLSMFESGVAELSALHSKILQPETHAELLRLSENGAQGFRLGNALWARIVYEFAAAYHHTVLNREHLVQALIPIYRGRVYSFITQHRSSDAAAMEADLADLCQEFVKQKSYFAERWKTIGEGAQ
jgi:hypothetical protein